MVDRDGLKTISRDLGLAYEPQDWGIINSSAQRLLEFMLYYERKGQMSNSSKYEMIELIVASANDAMCEKALFGGKLSSFIEWVAGLEGDPIANLVFSYWKGIINDEYPIGSLLT